MEKIVNNTLKLASKWQHKALKIISKKELAFQSQIDAMLKHKKDKQLLIDLLDKSFRASNPYKTANQIKYIFKKYGVASFFTTQEKLLINIFLNTTIFAPISVPLFINHLRKTTENVVIFGEKNKLNKYLKYRIKNGYDININIIGEIILSEYEAKNKIDEYKVSLQNPNINYMSVKISTIFSQINSLDRENTINEISKRLQTLYREAIKNSTKENPKLVNLDMEEYRDLDLTVSSFIKTLSLDEFKHYRAGIVIQAYIPQSIKYLEEIINWAKKRVNDGGSPVKVRLVKGANKELEETESSIKDWPLATYETKIDTDSNFKKMLNLTLISENIKVVNIGVGSHNVFDIAYAKTLAEDRNILEYVEFEMLEGIATNNRDIIKKNHGVLLYAPVAKKEHFINSIGYLVRRFDENTSDDNFLRYNFKLKPNSKAWNNLKDMFIKSYENIDTLSNDQKRVQNRLKDKYETNSDLSTFIQESDTDFTILDNVTWANKIRDKYKKIVDAPLNIPIVINGKEKMSKEINKNVDKSQNSKLMANISIAQKDDISSSIKCGKNDREWANKSDVERAMILKKVAKNFRNHRGDLIGITMAEVGKTLSEVDIEVSEAIDFLEFYPYSKDLLQKEYNVKITPLGLGVVISPWNFPVAIPTGGIVATLTAGNNCIIKPSTISSAVAYSICKLFWDAGISKKTLQFLPTHGSLANDIIIKESDVNFVILTGSEKTAKQMLKTNNKLFLSAETGGKNATIVTEYADKEQAVKNLLLSSFSNSGQKCSATSLLILEKSVYNDKNFLKMLVEATKSLNVGSVWNFTNILGTLSGSENVNLEKAFNLLEDGEKWLLKPTYLNKEKTIITPGIKIGTKTGYFTHLNELFAPILSIMSANNLDEAIEMVNMTGYGLTSGLESLNRDEQVKWSNSIKAGNLYINRSTTGAIVNRQQFGGTGKSAYGSGKKAGGMNYIQQFSNITLTKPIKDIEVKNNMFIELTYIDDLKFKDIIKNIEIVTKNYIDIKHKEFNVKHDYFNIRGESNDFKYIPYESLLIRVIGDESLSDILKILIASQISKIKRIELSIKDKKSLLANFIEKHRDKIIKTNVIVSYDNEEKFISKIECYEAIRYAQKDSISDKAFKKSAKHMKYLNYVKVIDEGRFELLNYHKEQNLSFSHHRYGNINILHEGI